MVQSQLTQDFTQVREAMLLWYKILSIGKSSSLLKITLKLIFPKRVSSLTNASQWDPWPGFPVEISPSGPTSTMLALYTSCFPVGFRRDKSERHHPVSSESYLLKHGDVKSCRSFSKHWCLQDWGQAGWFLEWMSQAGDLPSALKEPVVCWGRHSEQAAEKLAMFRRDTWHLPSHRALGKAERPNRTVAELREGRKR